MVAVVQGPAAGAGMSARTCALAAPEALFGVAFVKVGLRPDWGGSVMLSRLVNPAAGPDLMLARRRPGTPPDPGLAFGESVPRRRLGGGEALGGACATGPCAPSPASRPACWHNPGPWGCAGPTSTHLEAEGAQMKATAPPRRPGLAAFQEKRAPRFA